MCSFHSSVRLTRDSSELRLPSNSEKNQGEEEYRPHPGSEQPGTCGVGVFADF